MKRFIVTLTERAPGGMGIKAGVYTTVMYHEAENRERAVAEVDAWLETVTASFAKLISRTVTEVEAVKFTPGTVGNLQGKTIFVTPSGEIH